MSKDDDFVRGRCEDCGLILLTNDGLMHVKREMFDKRLRDKEIRRDIRDHAGQEDIVLYADEITEKIGILVCNSEINKMTRMFEQMLERKASKKKKKRGIDVR